VVQNYLEVVRLKRAVVQEEMEMVLVEVALEYQLVYKLVYKLVYQLVY